MSKQDVPSGDRPPEAAPRESCNPAEAANDRLAACAKDAMRVFVARSRGVDASDVHFPDLADFDPLVDLLTGLRHFARHMANDYAKADRQARRRHGEQYAQETSWTPER